MNTLFFAAMRDDIIVALQLAGGRMPCRFLLAKNFITGSIMYRVVYRRREFRHQSPACFYSTMLYFATRIRRYMWRPREARLMGARYATYMPPLVYHTSGRY